jgi:hypothetical protein
MYTVHSTQYTVSIHFGPDTSSDVVFPPSVPVCLMQLLLQIKRAEIGR